MTDDLGGDALPRWVARNASDSALVILDVPIEGCEQLCRSTPWRTVDSRLARSGIPILPSYKSGDRGHVLRSAIHRERPDLRVLESYPYAVLRVLWGLQQETGAPGLSSQDYESHTSRWKTWWYWPPRYKRARNVLDRRAALEAVGDLLRACAREYEPVVKRPAKGTSTELAQLSDEYDALLGLVAARAAVTPSRWSWQAEVPGTPGAIVTIAPPWLRASFMSPTARARHRS